MTERVSVLYGIRIPEPKGEMDQTFIVIDDEPSWNDYYRRALDDLPIKTDRFDEASVGIERILQTTQTGVLVAAMHGAWREVVDAAISRGTKPVVMFDSGIAAYDNKDIPNVRVVRRKDYSPPSTQNVKQLVRVALDHNLVYKPAPRLY